MLERKNNPSIVNALRDARLARGLTEWQLAAMAGCEPATIVAIEDGEYAPSISLALRLAWALGTPVEQLFWLPPPPPKPVGWGRGSDERTGIIATQVYMFAFFAVFLILFFYKVFAKLLALPPLADPAMTVTHLYLVFNTSIVVCLFATRLRLSKRWLKVLWYAAWGSAGIFAISMLGDDIGLTTPQILIALGGLLAVVVWTFAIRAAWRNRRPARLHESYGDG